MKSIKENHHFINNLKNSFTYACFHQIQETYSWISINTFDSRGARTTFKLIYLFI